MTRKFQNVRLFKAPSSVLILALLMLLPVGIFLILKMAGRGHSVHGSPADIAIVHVLRDGIVSRQSGVFVTRDGKYFRTASTEGFWSLYVSCKGYWDVLPEEWPLQKLQAAIASAQVQTMPPSSPLVRTRETWYVRAPTGNEHRCWRFIRDEAKATDGLQPLLTFFRAVQHTNIEQHKNQIKCEAGSPDYLDDWCNTSPGNR